jgi:DNA (cytosine-5)-methyltransferase 1
MLKFPASHNTREQKRAPDAKTGRSMPRVYGMVDLFAGCGGLSLGFENAGFTPAFVSELNEHAIATYLANRQHELGGQKFTENASLRCKDANELQGKRLEQLLADLANLSEIDLKFDTVSANAGGGSTLDVLTGGPPCQGFSGIGMRRLYAVERSEIPSNQLYQRMVKIICRLRPRIFLFENVRGLLTAKWSKEGGEAIWPDVVAEFKSISGYEVRWKLVYAKDYGVPQNRPRVLLVGIRKDIVVSSALLNLNAHPEDAVKCGFLPMASERTYPDLVDLLGDLVDERVEEVLRSQNFEREVFETTEYPSQPKSFVAEALRRPPKWAPDMKVALRDQEYSKHKLVVVEKFSHMLANGGKIPEQFKTKKFSQRVLLARWGTQSPNITATSLPDDYVHFRQPRILTVREWARLQLFPDWYQFKGKRTTGGLRRAGNPTTGLFDREVPKYTQIGNAVPVGLAEAVGRHFRHILDDALN